MKDISFSNEIEINVELTFHEQQLFGKLFFTKDSSSYLEIIANDILSVFSKECTDVIECQAGDDIYTLMGCNKIGSKIFPKFVILNKPDELISFDEIEISINQLNSLLHDGYFDSRFKDNQFISSMNQSNFKVDVSDSKNISSISDYWMRWSDISHDDDVITKLIQRHIISIKTKRHLNYEEVIKESRHICLLFSLLTLMQLHINFAWVVYKNNRYPIYFQTLKPTSSRKVEWHQSLIYLKDIEPHIWSTIINKSYKDTSFPKLWARFYGMLSYNSYWEYEFLGFMSILDFYLSSKYTFKDKRENTFKNRYIKKLKDTSKNINNFIGLPLDKFEELLTIRNGVAHCDPEKLDVIDKLPVLMILKNRLIVLLNYLAITDLGITEKDYAISALRSFNPVLFRGVTQKKWLNKIIGDIPEVTLSEDNYKKLINYKRSINNIIIISIKSKDFIFDENLSTTLNDTMHSAMGKYDNICDYIDDKLLKNIEGEYISEYINTLHIHTFGQDEFIEATAVYILNKIN